MIAIPASCMLVDSRTIYSAFDVNFTSGLVCKQHNRETLWVVSDDEFVARPENGELSIWSKENDEVALTIDAALKGLSRIQLSGNNGNYYYDVTTRVCCDTALAFPNTPFLIFNIRDLALVNSFQIVLDSIGSIASPNLLVDFLNDKIVGGNISKLNPLNPFEVNLLSDLSRLGDIKTKRINESLLTIENDNGSVFGNIIITRDPFVSIYGVGSKVLNERLVLHLIILICCR